MTLEVDDPVNTGDQTAYDWSVEGPFGDNLLLQCTLDRKEKSSWKRLAVGGAAKSGHLLFEAPGAYVIRVECTWPHSVVPSIDYAHVRVGMKQPTLAVTVNGNPIETGTVIPMATAQNVTIDWEATNATACYLNDNNGQIRKGVPSGTYSYRTPSDSDLPSETTAIRRPMKVDCVNSDLEFAEVHFQICVGSTAVLVGIEPLEADKCESSVPGVGAAGVGVP